MAIQTFSTNKNIQSQSEMGRKGTGNATQKDEQQKNCTASSDENPCGEIQDIEIPHTDTSSQRRPQFRISENSRRRFN